MSRVIPFVHRIEASEAKEWIDRLQSSFPEHKIVDFADLEPNQYNQVEVAVVANPDPSQLLLLPELIWIQSVWAGVEGMMSTLPADILDKVEIVRLIDPGLAQTMSEAVLAWALYLHRDMPLYKQQQQEKLWQQHRYTQPAERKVGILGLGELGTLSAKRLLANGFNVSGWSRSEKRIDNIQTYCGEEGLNKVLHESDIIVNLLPLTPATRAILSTERFQQFKKGSSLINFGRGATIDETALLDALNSEHLQHAVLDVFNIEPLPTESPIWQHNKITVLPHISAPTPIGSACLIVIENLKRYFDAGKLPKTVDKSKGY